MCECGRDEGIVQDEANQMAASLQQVEAPPDKAWLRMDIMRISPRDVGESAIDYLSRISRIMRYVETGALD